MACFQGNQSLCFTCKLRLFTEVSLRGSLGPHNAADVGEDLVMYVTLREEVGCMMAGTEQAIFWVARSHGTDLDVWC